MGSVSCIADPRRDEPTNLLALHQRQNKTCTASCRVASVKDVVIFDQEIEDGPQRIFLPNRQRNLSLPKERPESNRKKRLNIQRRRDLDPNDNY